MSKRRKDKCPKCGDEYPAGDLFRCVGCDVPLPENVDDMSEETMPTTARERAFREWLYKHLELKYPEEQHASREAAVEKILGGEDWIFTVDEVRLAFRTGHVRLETELGAAQGALLCAGAVRGDLGWHADECDMGKAEGVRSCSPFCELARAALAPQDPGAKVADTDWADHEKIRGLPVFRPTEPDEREPPLFDQDALNAEEDREQGSD